MTESSVPRRRGAVRTEEILRVTLETAIEVGYRGLTLKTVAQRAGVGKHTIYRRWPSLFALLLDALCQVWTSDLDYRDTGDVHADLREQFVRSSGVLATAPVYRALIAEAQADGALRATLHERFLAAVEASTLRRVERAQQAGELVSGVDLTHASEVLCGALYYRAMLSDRPVDEPVIDGLLDMFMAAYGTR